MKKLIITLLTLFMAGVIAVGALAVRIYRNFSWLDEESGIEEKDVVYFEYNGIRYSDSDMYNVDIEDWTDESLLRIGMDVDFPCGDTLRVVMDHTGTKWRYCLLGLDVDITRFVTSETHAEHRTVWEEVHSIN